MARFETVCLVPRPLEATFAFVSDFRNAMHWDPRTYAVEQSPPGPPQVGTRFLLTGGVLPEHLVKRLRLPSAIAGMPLPYDIVLFRPPYEFVLEGETRLFRYRDHLTFAADGDRTRVGYLAELHLRGPLAVGEPLLHPVFQRIGRDATRGLPAAVARGAGDHSPS